MGREVKRVPIGFDWPIGRTWFGYILDPVPCEWCVATPDAGPYVRVCAGREYESRCCPVCDGEGAAYPVIEVPDGPGWQMWEDCSEGSPISPVFRTADELASWLADTGASAFGSMTATKEEWLAMIGSGWAPSAIFSSAGLRSGVAAALEATDHD